MAAIGKRLGSLWKSSLIKDARTLASDSRAQKFNPLYKKSEEPVYTIVQVNTKVGEPMQNLSILTGVSDPILLADDEYPPWVFEDAKSLPAKSDSIATTIQPNSLSSRKDLKRMRKQTIKDNNAKASNK